MFNSWAVFFPLLINLINKDRIPPVPHGNGISETTISTEKANLGQFPFLAFIACGTDYICSGAIYDNEHIVTTASCVKQLEDCHKQKTVLAGIVDLTKLTGSEQSVRIHMHLAHEQYNPSSSEYNFGVIALASRFVFNENVHSILIADKHFMQNNDDSETQETIVVLIDYKLSFHQLEKADWKTCQTSAQVSLSSLICSHQLSKSIHSQNCKVEENTLNTQTNGGLLITRNSKGESQLRGMLSPTKPCDAWRFVNIPLLYSWVVEVLPPQETVNF